MCRWLYFLLACNFEGQNYFGTAKPERCTYPSIRDYFLDFSVFLQIKQRQIYRPSFKYLISLYCEDLWSDFCCVIKYIRHWDYFFNGCAH